MAKTSFDTKFLAATGVLDDDPVADVACSEAEWRHLVAQLRRDLEADEAQIRSGERLFESLSRAYQRIEDENVQLRRQLRRLREQRWPARAWRALVERLEVAL